MIELVFVLAIISIMILISVNGYVLFRKKALTVEARMALTTIQKLEVLYYGRESTYTDDLNELQFEMQGKCRYTYQVVSADKNGFQASARGDLDGDPELDIWTIDEQGILNHLFTD